MGNFGGLTFEVTSLIAGRKDPRARSRYAMTSSWPASTRLSSGFRGSGFGAGAAGRSSRHSQDEPDREASALIIGDETDKSVRSDRAVLETGTDDPQQWQAAAGLALQHAFGAVSSAHAFAESPTHSIPANARKATERRFGRWWRVVMLARSESE